MKPQPRTDPGGDGPWREVGETPSAQTRQIPERKGSRVTRWEQRGVSPPLRPPPGPGSHQVECHGSISKEERGCGAGVSWGLLGQQAGEKDYELQEAGVGVTQQK